MFHQGQHIVCSQCLGQMVKKDSRSIEYIECPTCREKCFRRLDEIPKSLVMLQLLEASRGSQRYNAPSSNNFASNQRQQELIQSNYANYNYNRYQNNIPPALPSFPEAYKPNSTQPPNYYSINPSPYQQPPPPQPTVSYSVQPSQNNSQP